MSYSIITVVLLAIVALSSAKSPLNHEQNVLARFYSNFAQLYRPATSIPVAADTDRPDLLERFEFLFSEKEYSHVCEESLTMLYTNVTERTITYHPMPNFEEIGSRYMYRPDPKENYMVEIELINAEDLVFRDVRRSNRYFYLTTLDGLQFVRRPPVMPFYAVSFTCNSSFPKTDETQVPILSYLDKSYQWTPRYSLDIPMLGTGEQSNLVAYADIRNNGDQSIVLKGVELIAGDIKLTEISMDYLRRGLIVDDDSLEKAVDTHVYQLPLSSSILLPPRSQKSVKFMETDVKVTSFVHYRSDFSTGNSTGKLFNAYNITCLNNFLPTGRLLLREHGRFIGQMNLPDLTLGETYTMVFGFDANVVYRRQVILVDGDDDSDSVTYNVTYTFENYKPSYDIRLYFVESFNYLDNFEISNISTSMDDKHLPDLVIDGTVLRGYVTIPRQRRVRMISYQIITRKAKPETTTEVDDN